jgi:hypothetical protein
MARKKGSTVSPEARARMSEAAKRRWADWSVDVSWNLSSAIVLPHAPAAANAAVDYAYGCRHRTVIDRD